MQSYKKIIRALKKNYPCNFILQIKRIKMSSLLDGDCRILKNKAIIRINKNLTETSAIDTLIHEYVHLICFNLYSNYNGEHNKKWGIIYAKIYREIIEKHSIK